MAVKHDRISELLGEEQEDIDKSLRGRALERARSESVPRTLTPYEWEQWYAEHGVPDEHQRERSDERPVSWWRRWLGLSR